MSVMRIALFKKNIKRITNYYKKLIIKTKNNESIGSINEWIVDNFYVISEQINYVLDSYNYREVNKIRFQRQQQLYSLIYNTLRINDFQINIGNLYRGLNTYQTETKDYFSYYETNLIYVFIRMVLISELSELCKRIEVRLNEKDEIDELFKNISKLISKEKGFDLEKYIKINDHVIKRPYYIEHINHHLTDLGPVADESFIKINKIIEKRDMTLRELIEQSQNEVAADNLLMMNIFNSLRVSSRFRHEHFYKNINFAEKVLISEKENIYYHIYENNKQEYRGKIIKNAKKKGMSEFEYAYLIVEQANKDNKHVGWYLFKEKNYMLRARIYIASIATLTLVLTSFLTLYMGFSAFLLLLVPASVIVMEIISQLLIHFERVHSIFKLKFEEGLPEEFSTMAIIATIVNNGKKVEKMFEKLELYYLSSMTENIYFALLGDCTSESVKDTPRDQEIIEVGLRKVNELNEKYGKNIFYFAYRNRFYNEGERSFLGFERKRGAILHFNKLVLNKLTAEEKKEYFNVHTFNNFNIPIKYVITLDTDTKLVLNTALKMVGAMAHPMNQPVLSEDRKKVISGYAIMQPRVNIDVEVTSKSQYSQLFAGLGGLDVYVTASFDLYQDVFNEGSFVGKGIYDLAVFDEVLSGTFPNNLILSHDLLEGNYLRCGFINDVELFDDFPSNYLSDAKRHHRWNRGDWQIIGWLKKKVRNAKEKKVSNPLNILNKWKIFDNLRRSLISPFLLLLLIYGFTIGKGEAHDYLIFVSSIIAIPIFFYLLSQVIYRNKYDLFLKYYLNFIKGIFAVVNRSIVTFAVLPYEAYLYVDSIIRALYRMFISKKNLLNWIISEVADKMTKNDLTTYIKSFSINYFFAILLIVLTVLFKPHEIDYAAIIASIWFLAPFLMYVLSRKIVNENVELDDDEKEEIREICAKTWAYFDDLLTEERNYLIPDNFQLNRELKVDNKTSPTNIGFSMVSVISAYELGLISVSKALQLLSNIIMNTERLEKWKGNLYNWYDIRTFNKLHPSFISSVDNGNFLACLYVTKGFLEKQGAIELINRVKKLIEEMDLRQVYNKDIDVFSVGYKVDEQMLLPFNYNNFASESRLTSFIAISRGDVPYKHWFCLDKTLTKYKHYKGVVSWAGTCFEYFMPLIFMRTFRHTLLDETYYFAYYAQREYIKEIDPKLPWGISESSYNELDDLENYKYGSFGIPYLKFQESPSYPIIISPYSSIMAISVDDREVYNNMNKLKKLNMFDRYGFFDAYDHEEKAVVKNYYAHHQGMILASLTNYLKDNIIQDYFHSDRKIESIEMLLKEKVQIRPYIDIKVAKHKKYQYVKEYQENDVREYSGVSDSPELGCLSNGSYAIVIDDRGKSLSKYNNLQMNRYRKVSSDDYGIFLYIKNLTSNNVWTNTYAPLNTEPDTYKVIFACDRVKYVREDDGIVTQTEIAVAKDHNAELRKITFQNKTDYDVTLEVTSYSEVIIRRPEEELAHPVFNNVTINSEVDKETSSLIFSRKSKTKDNTTYFLINRLFMDDERNSTFEFETSKMKFIGRNNTVANPDAIFKYDRLSSNTGSSLDSIMSIRKKIKIKAGGKNQLYLLVGFGKSKEQVLEIAEAYKDEFTVNKAFDMATVLSNIRNKYANITAHQMSICNKILKCIFIPTSNLAKREELLKKNNKKQSALWELGISGNTPIMMAQIDNIEDIGFIRRLLQVYEYFKARTISADLVIVNNIDSSKKEDIEPFVDNYLYHVNSINEFSNTPGKVVVLESSKIDEETYNLLKMVSLINLHASSEKALDEQVQEHINDIKLIPKGNLKLLSAREVELPKEIDCYNGYGGFVNQGSEYLIDKLDTPTPWSNVIANEKFGCVITNNFGGFTYAYNSREFKLTSWSNDATKDPSSEIIIINNQIFKPSFVKHGFGYSLFYSSTDKFDVFIKVFVAREDTIKFYEMTINNKLNTKQNLKIDLALKMVLGVSEELTNRYIYSYFDDKNNRLYFKNNYSHFKNTNVFVSSTERINDYSIEELIKSVSINVELDKSSTKTISFMLGCEEDDTSLDKYKDNNQITEAYNTVTDYWQQLLSTVTVNTPDKTLNYVLNGWYLYQVYASRLYSKAGFYQVGGAIGFRDQLQDAMGTLYSNQDYARKQILIHASHQFREGDVLHWWHEDLMFGSRTRFSDDYLWLIYVTSEYLKITNDYSILEEKVPYVEARKLDDYESEVGLEYNYSIDMETLYDHLKLCIAKSVNQLGKHGLPLMGSGDWNDGMNKVGYHGKGESVFVGFFLYDLLLRMIDISKSKNDEVFSKLCLDNRANLEASLNKSTWDGEWYLRAYYDNGEPLGSRNNDECQIDLLCQAWSIISNFAPKDKKKSLINNVESLLVDKEHKIIKLLAPAFKESRNNPGYIKDYIAGVRENGGQYTHAALWYILALLIEGEIDLGYEYYQMINPINRTMTTEDANKYKVEPYVIVADIYSNPNHLGRGGWSWYTGSASWAYKIGLEEILGFQKRGDKLIIKPKVSCDWDNYQITYKYKRTTYLINVNNPKQLISGKVKILFDNKKVKNNIIELKDDGKVHTINVDVNKE